MTDSRLQRLCDLCGQLDDHPRHVQAVPPEFPGAVPSDAFIDGLAEGTPPRAVAELMDPTTVVRHMDCCAATGCDLCREVLASAGGATGKKLTAHVTSGAVDHLSSEG